MLNISEIFGPTIQGEGVYTGTPSIFVRLNGCNLCCSFGDPGNNISRSLCDTSYTSIHPNKSIKMSAVELVDKLEELTRNTINLRHIVITGGEPLLQQNELIELINEANKRQLNFLYTIETNGSIIPEQTLLDNLYIFWSVSPKLSSSCCFINSNISEKRQELHKIKRINIKALASITNCLRYQLKFVYSNEFCIEEIKNIVNQIVEYKLKNQNFVDWARIKIHNKIQNDIYAEILLMPEGATREQLENTAEKAVKAAIDNGWRYCDRTHIRIWNDKRKV